jgi:hypothetical protein
MRSEGKAPKNGDPAVGIYLHGNAPAHRSALANDLLAKSSMTTLEHLLFSPDVAALDLCQFPRLKSAWQGRCFCDASDLIKNATEELKRLSQNGFQEH